MHCNQQINYYKLSIYKYKYFFDILISITITAAHQTNIIKQSTHFKEKHGKTFKLLLGTVQGYLEFSHSGQDLYLDLVFSI